jgi:hypothetical protein
MRRSQQLGVNRFCASSPIIQPSKAGIVEAVRCLFESFGAVVSPQILQAELNPPGSLPAE